MCVAIYRHTLSIVNQFFYFVSFRFGLVELMKMGNKNDKSKSTNERRTKKKRRKSYEISYEKEDMKDMIFFFVSLSKMIGRKKEKTIKQTIWAMAFMCVCDRVRIG